MFLLPSGCDQVGIQTYILVLCDESRGSESVRFRVSPTSRRFCEQPFVLSNTVSIEFEQNIFSTLLLFLDVKPLLSDFFMIDVVIVSLIVEGRFLSAASHQRGGSSPSHIGVTMQRKRTLQRLHLRDLYKGHDDDQILIHQITSQGRHQRRRSDQALRHHKGVNARSLRRGNGNSQLDFVSVVHKSEIITTDDFLNQRQKNMISRASEEVDEDEQVVNNNRPSLLNLMNQMSSQDILQHGRFSIITHISGRKQEVVFCLCGVTALLLYRRRKRRRKRKRKRKRKRRRNLDLSDVDLDLSDVDLDLSDVDPSDLDPNDLDLSDLDPSDVDPSVLDPSDVDLDPNDLDLSDVDPSDAVSVTTSEQRIF
ncbi:hypothetical protein F2P81_022814 [Scophthalmus maximus]|uniref:Uncharacterized protein n=1 Tax=Scophthalmus maximus TaxID=52904 RepID=A0A6A4RV91_SCOMX|nr:hypothetical protein F2P81_022814 [Scophthalmus maximus]